ncbi:MAG: hypothetical protein KZQ78_09550 [Candidatus Thiodiazotropha sp. (ex Ustalcina ferruginea)]|nr:hypothetical protein [Candidatus Thiodiazotropha sp. (ex Ustalcina ferruginea)]
MGVVVLKMFGLIKNKPLLNQASTDWLHEAFGWSLRNFNADYFHTDTWLVLPTNECFPGVVDSTEGMAKLIFEQVKHYAGVRHWPTLVIDQNQCPLMDQTPLLLQGAIRGEDVKGSVVKDQSQRLPIPYNPQQINNPEGMIASFAHILAYYLGQMSQEPPSGGAGHWPETTELLAIFMGFGLMFANSAFTFKGGCGSCYNPSAVRQAALSEYEATYALALFAVLKEIPNATVSRHFKKHLRGFYKKAVKEIQSNREGLAELMSIGREPAPQAEAGL